MAQSELRGGGGEDVQQREITGFGKKQIKGKTGKGMKKL